MRRSVRLRPGELSRPERWLHLTAAVAVGGSGLAFWWMKYGLAPPQDPFSLVNHPWQPQMLHLHVLAAPVWILMTGLMLRDHVIARLRDPARRRGRRSGTWTVALLGPMVASGYLLQVATHEITRHILVWVHVASGCAWVAAFGAHVLVGRLAARRARRGRDGSGVASLRPGELHLRSIVRPASVRAAPSRGRAGGGDDAFLR